MNYITNLRRKALQRKKRKNKKSCGKTVTQRLTEIRLHHAKELLAGTSRRLYEIANAVGYGDGKYFVKLFTREVGLSPREYRGRHSYEE